MVGTPPAEDKARNQCAAAAAQTNGYVAYVQRQGTYYGTYENTHRQEHHIGSIRRRVGVTHLFGCQLHLYFASHKLNHIASVKHRLREHRYTHTHAPDALYHNAMHERLCTQLAYPLAVERFLASEAPARHCAFYHHHRESKQSFILNLFTNPFLLANRVLMPSAQHHLIARVQNLLRPYIINNHLAFAYTLHEQTLALTFEEVLQVEHRASFLEPLVLYAVAAELHLAPCLHEPRLVALVLAHARLQVTARTLYLLYAAQHPRPQSCQNPCRPCGTENIRYRVCHRHYVKHLLLLLGRKSHPAYRIIGNTNHRAYGLRARQKPCRLAHVVAHYGCYAPCREQYEQAHQCSKTHLRQALLAQSRKELWPHLVTYGKQEQQERRLLQRPRHGNIQLPHNNTHKQHTCDNTQAEPLDMYSPDKKTHSKHQINRQLRMRTKKVSNPLHNENFYLLEENTCKEVKV